MNSLVWLAAVVMGAALWWLWPAPSRGLADLDQRPRQRRWVRWLPTAVALVAVPAAFGVRISLWLLSVAVVVGTGGRLARAARRREARERVRAEVAEGCQVVASQLQVGVVAGQALVNAAQDCPVLAPVSASQGVGADVPAALRRASGEEGAEGLADLAAAWALASRSGAPIADIAGRVARELAEEERLRRMVEGELAAPRASGKLLALLPLVGLAMASMVGADPAHFLLGTLVGQICVVAAVVLSCGGLVWTEHLADRASEVGAR